jgi:hypothetical protein
MKPALVASSLLLWMSTSGCMTILRGTQQQVEIKSQPSNAQVTYRGRIVGTTPVKLIVPRDEGPTVILDKKGYAPKSMTIKFVSNPAAVIASTILGVFVGFIVDALSGAIYDLEPATVTVKLEPLLKR